MTHIEAVVHLVENMGSATVDELQSRLPKLQRRQIADALKRGRMAGLVHADQELRLGRQHSGAQPVRHFPGRASEAMKPVRKAETHYGNPVASVWELGTPRDIPIPRQRGRVFNLLGGWTD